MTCIPTGDGYICGNFPARYLAPNPVLAVGFGIVTLTKDDEEVWYGDDETVRLRDFASRYRKEPGVWRLNFYGALSESTYERQKSGRWLLVKKGGGFA